MLKNIEGSGIRPDMSNELNKSLNRVGLSLEGVPAATQVAVSKTLSESLLAATAFAMSEDDRFGRALADRVVRLRREAVNTLKANRSYSLNLDIPGLKDPENYEPTPEDLAPSVLATSLGSFAMIRVALANKDGRGSIAQLYGATTPRTSLSEGELQITFIGLESPVTGIRGDARTKWEAPLHMDPLRPDLLSPKDLLVYLSGANQLGLVGSHKAGESINVSDPRHLINLLQKLEDPANPKIGNHWADSLEEGGKRQLLTATSTKKIIAPNEWGESVFQDPINTTPVVSIGQDRVIMGIVLAPELMIDIDSLEPMRANRRGSLEALQGMALAARFAQRLGDRLDRVLPKSGLV
jgi:hypothetical protein